MKLRKAAIPAVVSALVLLGACDDDGTSASDDGLVALVDLPVLRETAADLGVPIDDGSDPGELGEQLGGSMAASVLDMARLEPGEYRERFGSDASQQALLLGRLLGSLETTVPAVIDGADDRGEARREALGFGLAVSWSITEAFDPAAPAIERLLTVMPRDLRDRVESADAADDVAEQLDAGRYGAAADTLLDAFPRLDPAELFAEIARELSEQIPAEHLQAFLSALDVTNALSRPKVGADQPETPGDSGS